MKAKLTGEVLQKIGSVERLTTWTALKTALREKIKPLVSFAGAQEAIINNKQKPTETIRQFGARIKILLKEINKYSVLYDSRSGYGYIFFSRCYSIMC